MVRKANKYPICNGGGTSTIRLNNQNAAFSQWNSLQESEQLFDLYAYTELGKCMKVMISSVLSFVVWKI